jgi:CRP/FNR family transcriptional regulator, cyclic AMP receptor protein
MVSRALQVEKLRNVPLFARCTTGDLRIIARHLDIVEVAAGTDVVREGEMGDVFFVVLEGQVAVLRNGRKAADLEAGAHFGELALLDPAPRDSTVRATTALVVGALGHRMFKVLVRDMPSLAAGLLASMAAQLRAAHGEKR